MPLIEWKEEYSVQNRLFDEHHQKLVDIINELSDNIEQKKSGLKLNLTFSKLIEYAQIHFDSEETVLEQYHYPGLAQQKAEHASFVSKIKSMREQLKQDHDQDLEQQVLNFLKGWLISHILESDQGYSLFLNEHNVS